MPYAHASSFDINTKGFKQLVAFLRPLHTLHASPLSDRRPLGPLGVGYESADLKSATAVGGDGVGGEGLAGREARGGVEETYTGGEESGATAMPDLAGNGDGHEFVGEVELAPARFMVHKSGSSHFTLNLLPHLAGRPGSISYSRGYHDSLSFWHLEHFFWAQVPLSCLSPHPSQFISISLPLCKESTNAQ